MTNYKLKIMIVYLGHCSMGNFIAYLEMPFTLLSCLLFFYHK
jgi:hypothetical protein